MAKLRAKPWMKDEMPFSPARAKRMRSRANDLNNVFAYALVSYGIVALPKTWYFGRHLVRLVKDCLLTGSTHPYCQNWDAAAVVNIATETLGIWIAIPIGTVLLLYPHRRLVLWMFPGLLLLGGLSEYVIWEQDYAGPLMQHLNGFSTKLAVPIACFIAILLIQKLKRTRATDGASCDQCGYKMRGLKEPRCPECGRAYTLDEFYQL